MALPAPAKPPPSSRPSTKPYAAKTRYWSVPKATWPSTGSRKNSSTVVSTSSASATPPASTIRCSPSPTSVALRRTPTTPSFGASARPSATSAPTANGAATATTKNSNASKNGPPNSRSASMPNSSARRVSSPVPSWARPTACSKGRNSARSSSTRRLRPSKRPVGSPSDGCHASSSPATTANFHPPSRVSQP